MDRAAIELEKLRAEVLKIDAETEKIITEAAKLKRERFFYPFVVFSGATLAVVGVVKLFL